MLLVALKGMPGSGKSTLGRAINAILCEVHEVTVTKILLANPS